MGDFWITNITKRIVSVGDLGLMLQPYQSMNLLDHRNRHLILPEHIEVSVTSGSLYHLRDKIVVRKVAPPAKDINNPSSLIEVERDQIFPSKVRSIIEHEEFNYDELLITDDEYAAENADLADQDDVGRYKKE